MDSSSLVVFVVLLGLVPLAIFFGYLGSQKRREAMQRVAAEQGLAFKPDGDFIPKVLSHFELFQRGHRRVAYNLMEDVSDAQAFWIFDYRYRVGSGRHSRTYRQTVVVFPYLDVNLPAFTIRREHLFHKIGSAFGYQDIDFPDHPSFSTRHLVRGKDERSIRELFNDTHLICAIDEVEHICLEGGGSCLMVFRDNKLVRPDRVMHLFNEAQSICNAFAARCNELGWEQRHAAPPYPILHELPADETPV